jgi:predicted HicB family RNase H-like nuclease
MKHINLRVPDDLHARLVAAAERDRRSLNGEILWLLERIVELEDPES